MANTYNFRINSVDVYTSQNGLEKVIYNVHWSYIGQDENGNKASILGVKSISEPDPENFTEFDSLVQDNIISWIEPLLPVETMQADIDAQIAEKVAPTKQTLTVPVSLQEEYIEETTTEEATTEETSSNQTVVDASEAEQVEGSESAATEESTEETV